jgi:hypothetical protein
MTIDTTDALDMALRYASAGFRVLPLHRAEHGECSCGTPCKTPGKHPRTLHGANDATTDETTIRAWWQRWPDANVGMALDGHVVVDIDPRNGGDVDEMASKLPDTCYARTGGGGMHYLYRAAPDARYNGHAGPGVDLKHGPNQYICVEPSIHPSGERYGWLDESEPWTTAPTPAPDWLAQRPTDRAANWPVSQSDKSANLHTSHVEVPSELARDLRSALTAIRADDYHEWIRIGHALATLGDVGRSLWLEWSSTSDKYDAPDAARRWETFRPKATGHQTIFETAQAAGWVNPAKGNAKPKTTPKTAKSPVPGQSITVDDFYAYLPDHQYIYRPTRELWKSEGVNGCLPPVTIAGNAITPARWLDQNRGVEQITWAPGEPEVIEGKLIREGGFIERPGAKGYNLYRPPTIVSGNARAAGPWLDHLHRLYPNEADELALWFAQRVQDPGCKINHAIVLAGNQGVGKDTILEPVKRAVGPWNWSEIGPAMLMGRFNGWARSVIVRVSEVRDLGDVDRFAFYEHIKIYAAAPPDVLRLDEKNLREYTVPNVLGLVLTTNYGITGMYLPPDDRRHFVASSSIERSEFDPEYFPRIYRWFEAGGFGHVAAYLREMDLSKFNPKAPPRQTPAHRAIVMANTAPEEGELADLIEVLGNPDVVSVQMMRESAENRRLYDLVSLLDDPKRRRVIPHRMGDAGYDPVPNPDRKDGLWWISGRRGAIYARRALPIRARIEAARGFCA